MSRLSIIPSTKPILPGIYVFTGTIGSVHINWPAMLRAEGVPFRGRPLTLHGRLNRRGRKALRMAIKQRRKTVLMTIATPIINQNLTGAMRIETSEALREGWLKRLQANPTPMEPSPQPATSPRAPFEVKPSEAVPEGEAWVIQDGKRIGRVTGIRPSEEP